MLTRPERWQNAAFAAAPVAAARMLSRAADGPRALHEGALVSTRLVALDSGRAFGWETNVPSGKCLRVSVGVEGEGAGLSLRVFDAQGGEEIDRAHGAHAVSARACAPTRGTRAVRVELSAFDGKATAVVGERLTD